MNMTHATDPLKVPPHDIDAEKSVLGGILIDSSSMYLIIEFLKAPHFYAHEHQVIYAAMISLYEKQQPIDVVTLKSELQKEGNIKKIGSVSYLSELINTVPTAAYVVHYGHIVKNHYAKRKLIEISSRTVEEAFDKGTDIKKLLDHVETDIYTLSQESSSQEFAPLKSILTESLARIEEMQRNKDQLRGVPTGYRDLDAVLAGFQKSNLIILAARPGIGKTSFALNIALQAATSERKNGIGFFSLEMSKEELVDRLLVSQADIDAWRLKTGKLSSEDHESLVEAMAELSETPIFIDDTPGISILDMRAKARRLKTEHNIDMIVVDYLQLADPGKRFDSRTNEVSYISQGLKNLARELKIPVLSLSQLSRAVEQRGASKKPQLSDLRESGAIEQDADVVMFLYSEADTDDLLPDPTKRTVKLSIAKHRNGATAEIDLMFRGDRVKFFGMEKTT